MRVLLILFAAALTVSSARAQPYADVVFASDFNATGGFSRQCLNDGAGSFACDLIATGTDRWRAQGVAVADLDGDGDDDVVFAVAEGAGLSAVNRLCRNEGAGTFTCEALSSELDDSRDVAAADLDGDGDLDLAFANAGADGVGAVNRVCFNEGSGTFACVEATSDVAESKAVTAADFDGDGDADLVFGNEGAGTGGGINRLCLNDGAGTFACADVSPDNQATSGVEAADLDADGDLDLAVVNFFGRDRVCLNDGSAAFTCTDVSTDGGDTYAVAPADLDGDGDLDLAFANPISNNQNRTNRVCFNDGSATFTCTDVSADTDHSRDVAVADFDADGDPDLLFANERFYTFGPGTGQEQLCRNDGAGAFTCAYFDEPDDDTMALAVGNLGGMPIPVEPSASVPAGFTLSAAYPNPFNPATVLALAVPEAGTVTVAVFDALGRRVAVLHDGVLAAGSHTLRFEAADLPSGIYAVRASGASRTVSRRVTLVR